MKEAFVNKYNTADLSAGMITGNVMSICSNRALSTAGVIKGDEKHVLLLYNTGTLSAGVTAEDNRGVYCTKYDGMKFTCDGSDVCSTITHSV